jgi:hypothetical protein
LLKGLSTKKLPPCCYIPFKSSRPKLSDGLNKSTPRYEQLKKAAHTRHFPLKMPCTLNVQGFLHGLLALYKHIFLNMPQSFKVQCMFKGNCLVSAAFLKCSLLGVYSIELKFYLIRHLIWSRVFEWYTAT